jgi:acyl-CoA dehydrogenase
MNETAGRVRAWLRNEPDFRRDPFAGMQQAGLLGVGLQDGEDYAAIARGKACIAEATGLLGLSSVWAGRQVVNRFFVAGFGNAAQREEWLGRCLAVAISEPGVGAHPKHLRTRAVAAPGGFRITGEKAWASNAPVADALIVLAITAEAEGRKRYSAFFVPRGTPGLLIEDMPYQALPPSRHARVVLDGCFVPRAAMLGAEGEAYETMALPFRDVEDAVGVFGVLGSLRFAAERLSREDEEAQFSRGGVVALCAVFERATEAVVAALDAGALERESATLVGLRVLAAEILARLRAHQERLGPDGDSALAQVLDDVTAALSVARGPRRVRQGRLGR